MKYRLGILLFLALVTIGQSLDKRQDNVSILWDSREWVHLRKRVIGYFRKREKCLENLADLWKMAVSGDLVFQQPFTWEKEKQALPKKK